MQINTSTIRIRNSEEFRSETVANFDSMELPPDCVCDAAGKAVAMRIEKTMAPVS
jgi:hypothetical protein